MLLGTSALTVPWALALFLTDDGPTPLIWPWPGDLLSSRLIAVMLLTIGVLGMAGAGSATRTRPVLLMNLTYSIGIVAAGLMNAVYGRPLPLGYLAAFAVIGLASAAALLRTRPSSSQWRAST